jgi:hypothetical protein
MIAGIKCLNCGDTTDSKYCPNCGQKTSTTRFSLRNLFTDDIVTSVFELEKGFFYTLRQLLIRPGHAVRAYVEGKRATYYNYFSLLFLIVAVDILLQEFSQIRLSDLYQESIKSETFLDFVDKLNNEYAKAFVLGMIPVYAGVTFLLFRRANQNFAEHFVANAYRAALELFLGLFITLSTVFISNIEIFTIISQVIAIVALAYSIVFYFQYFRPDGYGTVSLIVRSVVASLAFYVLVMVALIAYLVSLALTGQWTPNK